jgi:micrococcal nuclease
MVGGGSNCSSAYPDVCISPPPPNLDGSDISYENFRVVTHLIHGFDSDRDGVGCEA